MAYVSIHGSRSRDGRQLIDGMNFNGEGAGRGFYFNPAAASEVSLELGGQSAERELGSVQANLIPREGGNAFSGSFFSNYTVDHPERHAESGAALRLLQRVRPRTAAGRRSFVPARDFARVDCVPCWNDINPRLGVAWNLFGNSKTAVKAGLGRYVEADRYYTQRDNNPVQTSVNTVNRTWIDENQNLRPDCDLANPLANGECRQVAKPELRKDQPGGRDLCR